MTRIRKLSRGSAKCAAATGRPGRHAVPAPNQEQRGDVILLSRHSINITNVIELTFWISINRHLTYIQVTCMPPCDRVPRQVPQVPRYHGYPSTPCTQPGTPGTQPGTPGTKVPRVPRQVPRVSSQVPQVASQATLGTKTGTPDTQPGIPGTQIPQVPWVPRQVARVSR